MKFEKYFSYQNLLKIYSEKFRYVSSIGIDHVSNNYFNSNKERFIKSISKKVLNGNYRFKPYKIILIPKSYKSYPRKICVSTIKDRLVMEAIREYLLKEFKLSDNPISISQKVQKFSDAYKSGEYKYMFRTDLKGFYDHINHRVLLKKLKNIGVDESLLILIKKILKNKQKMNSYKKDEDYLSCEKGVPQGLCISNLLANIYMLNVDNYMNRKKEICYIRYVDDMIIFSKKKFFKIGFWFLIKKLHLKLNFTKTDTYTINDKLDVEFLGYSIKDGQITVRESTVKKFMDSLENLFRSYKNNINVRNNSLARLEWALNLKISGAICNGKRYGWLFYYSRIEDAKLIRRLDAYISQLIKRYKITGLKPKKMINVYYEIKKKNFFELVNSGKANVINLDSITDSEEMISVILLLGNYTEISIRNEPEDKIPIIFKKLVFRNVKSLEMDLENLS